MNTQTRRKMIASFIFVILVCGVLFDHVPDRTVILQGCSNTISSDARIDGSGIKYAIRGERFSEQTPIVCLLRSTARNTGYFLQCCEADRQLASASQHCKKYRIFIENTACFSRFWFSYISRCINSTLITSLCERARHRQPPAHFTMALSDGRKKTHLPYWIIE